MNPEWLRIRRCRPRAMRLAAVAALLGCGPAGAQHAIGVAAAGGRAVALCDSGSYEVSVSQVVVGRERFAIECTASEVMVRVHSTITEGSAADLRTTLRLDPLLRPKYVTVVGSALGASVADTVSWSGDTALLRRGGREQAIQTSREASFVGANFHTGLWFTLSRYDLALGGRQMIPVFPSETLEVEPAGSSYPDGGAAGERPRTGTLSAYRLQVGGTPVLAWIDSKRRPVALIYQGGRTVAVREGEEFASLAAYAIEASQSQGKAASLPDSTIEAVGHSELVSFTTDSVTLSGTLTKPDNGSRFPVVVFVSGSGSQDRDGALTGLSGYRPFLDLANAFVARGVAVLRFDDRGVGSSEGSATDQATTLDQKADVAKAVAALRSRTDIDTNRIGLLGHSEGGLVALMAAASDPRIQALVLLAAPGTRGDTLLRAQLEEHLSRASGMTEQAKDSARRGQEQLFASVRATTIAKGSWLRGFLDLTPAAFASKIHVPVLIVHGALDRQVPVSNARSLASMLRSQPRSEVAVIIVDSLNHLLLPARTGAVEEYGALPVYRLEQGLLDQIGDWLRVRLAPAGGRP